MLLNSFRKCSMGNSCIYNIDIQIQGEAHTRIINNSFLPSFKMCTFSWTRASQGITSTIAYGQCKWARDCWAQCPICTGTRARRQQEQQQRLWRLLRFVSLSAVCETWTRSNGADLHQFAPVPENISKGEFQNILQSHCAWILRLIATKRSCATCSVYLDGAGEACRIPPFHLPLTADDRFFLDSVIMTQLKHPAMLIVDRTDTCTPRTKCVNTWRESSLLYADNTEAPLSRATRRNHLASWQWLRTASLLPRAN